MMVYTGWKHAREAKEERLKSAIQLMDSELGYASGRPSRIKRDLPAWVNFPDVEKVEWLNKVLQQVWPFVGQYMEKLLVETIAPSIRSSSAHLQTLSFTKVDMGDKAMKVVGIKAHTENDKGQVLLDLYISYVGNVEINVEVKRYFCKAGVKGIQLHGMMRVILEPLIGDVPIVGAVTMFFIRRPKLDINWTGLTNLLDVPGLNVMSDSMIMDAIASFLVLPNRLVVPLVPDLHVAQLRSPLPRGVVRIHLVEAQTLAAKDNYVKGVMAGLSDPYAILRVGPQTFTSKHIDNTDSPKWGEMYEVIVHEVPGQELEVEVYDKDPDQDDFLGRARLDLGIVKKSIAVDNWFTLKDAPSGRVHLKLEWLALLPNTDQLEQVLKSNESLSSKTADPPSSAILVVYLDKAEALPLKKGNKEPSPVVQLSVQDITRESKTCYTTVNPEWEEAFTFFIQDPREQDIDIQVKDADRVQTLGSLSIPLSRLLSTSSLALDQWFQLENSGQASRIYINAVLRVLWLDEEKITADVSSTLESVQRPQLTAPHSSFATEGVLRIHLLAGQNLVPKDNLMGGMVKGKSDPYVTINIGGETFTSQVIKTNLNPTWNEMYEVILTQLPGQEVHIEVLDKDMDMKDDFMGRLKISLTDIIDSQFTDQWYTLSDVKSGRIHLVLEWVPTFSESDRLDQVLQYHSRQSYQNKAVPSAGLLFVYLDQADSLPVKKSGKEPKVGAEMTLGKMSHKTTVCDRTTSPKWNEAFCFLVRDPREDVLVVKNNVPPEIALAPTSKIAHDPSEHKEAAVEAREEEESSAPDVVRPTCTSPDINFASEGLLRMILLEGQNLVAKDNMMGGMVKGKSDPYVKLNIGEVTFKSSVVKENLNPVWNEMYEVVLRPQLGQEVQLEVFDKDMDKDDFLGRSTISMSDIINSQYSDQVCTTAHWWYSLRDVKSGRVRLILEWVPTLSHNGTLDQVMQMQALQSYHNKTVPSAALLFVYLDRAHSLPVCDRSRAPQWKEGFYFSVRDPGEMLIVKLEAGPAAHEVPAGTTAKAESTPKTQETEGTNLANLVHATVTGLPERQLPLHASPGPDFGSEGVLRIHLLEAQNLVAKDNLMGGMVKGKSDPYVKVNIGTVVFKSQVIKENLNPTWNEMYELVLSGPTVADILFEAYDKDLDSDDFLGRFSVKLSEVVRQQYTDEWFTLNDVKSGRVHLILEWVPTVSRTLRLEQVLQLQSLQSFRNKAVPAAALLFVHLDRAHSLPFKKSGKEPKACAELVLDDTSHKSKMCERSRNPEWSESFCFRVRDPERQMLIVKLSSGWDQPMGSLVVSLRDVLREPGLAQDQWFDLDGASPESQILLRAELKILESKMAELISSGTLPCASYGSGHGQVKLSLSCSPQEEKLVVVVHGCRGLLSQSKDGVDGYVTLMLLPDKSKSTKRKTTVKKRDLNPEFNERFEFQVPSGELRFRQLSVSVKNDAASFRKRDAVGQVQIELGQLDLNAGVTEWFDLKDEAD
ncbi:extended synaptotagmin-1-like [Neosynchiropus ocellatus]